MRIALLSYRSKTHCGGQGVYVRHLSAGLVELGHDVEVFSGQPYPEVDERVPMVAATPARVTAVVPDRFVPVRVTEVPPLVLPAVGLSEVRVGGSW